MIFEKMAKAVREGNADTYVSLLSDGFEFVRHQSGETLDRDAAEAMIRGMIASGAWKVSDQRCIYENDDIIVSHAVMSFPDGSREAVMSVGLKKDGKMTRLETGATPLK